MNKFQLEPCNLVRITGLEVAAQCCRIHNIVYGVNVMPGDSCNNQSSFVVPLGVGSQWCDLVFADSSPFGRGSIPASKSGDWVFFSAVILGASGIVL